MAYVAAMISIGMTMTYLGCHEDLKVFIFLGLASYLAGILIGEYIEDRTNKRIKKLEDKLKETDDG